jgi:hypothetical protein
MLTPLGADKIKEQIQKHRTEISRPFAAIEAALGVGTASADLGMFVTSSFRVASALQCAKFSSHAPHSAAVRGKFDAYKQSEGFEGSL